MTEDDKANANRRVRLGCFGSCLSLLGFPVLIFGVWYLVAGFCIDRPCTDREKVGPVFIMVGLLLCWGAIATLRAMRKPPED